MNFADAAVYGNIQIPHIGDMTVGEQVECEILWGGACAATLYYIDGSVTYSKNGSHGQNNLARIDQQWHTVPCFIENGRASCPKPADAVGMYKELKPSLTAINLWFALNMWKS